MALFPKKNTAKLSERDIILRSRSQVKNIILIIDNPENIVHNILHKQFPNAEFSFLTYRTEKEDISTGKNYTFNKKDLKFGQLKNERLANLQKNSFDLLIDLSSKSSNGLRHFSQIIDARLKIGCFDTYENYLYDLLVQDTGDVNGILKQIERQLDLLTKN